MLLIGYIIVGGILLAWYKLIFYRELYQKNILRRSLKVLVNNIKIIIKNIFLFYEVDEKQQKELDYIKNKLFDVFTMIIYISGWCLISPIILENIMKIIEVISIRYALFVIFTVEIIVSKLKEITQECAQLVNEYIKGILLPIEHNPELIKKDESKRIKIKWTLNKVVEFIVYICVLGGFILVLYFIELNHQIGSIVGGTVIVILILRTLFEKIKSKAVVKKKEESIDIDQVTLGAIEPDVVNMCKKLKISNVKIDILKDRSIKIETYMDECGIPHIGVSYQFIEILRSEDNAKDILLYTIGHELAHIYYKDFNNIKRRRKISCFVYLVSYLFCILLFFVVLKFSVGIEVILYLVLCFLILQKLFFEVFCDQRYWYQIAELRADRLATQIYTGERMAFINFWKTYDEKIRSVENKENLIYSYYKKYIKVEAHPSMIVRMKLIEKRSKWYRWEYIEHILRIWKWRVTNKGWNGYDK